MDKYAKFSRGTVIYGSSGPIRVYSARYSARSYKAKTDWFFVSCISVIAVVAGIALYLL